MGAKWTVRERTWKSGDTVVHLVDDPTENNRLLTLSSQQEIERATKAEKSPTRSQHQGQYLCLSASDATPRTKATKALTKKLGTI